MDTPQPAESSATDNRVSNPAKGDVLHLPGLNGIRAIAAIAVVVWHITQSLSEFGLDPYIMGATSDGKVRGTDLGAFGVSMFFALSGFLITYLLLLEKEKTKTVAVKDFYIRRVLRIQPLYFGYMIVAIAVVVMAGLPFEADLLPYYIFFLANVPYIIERTFPLLGHYWSLGVEEQFYFFYPWLVKKAGNLTRWIIVITVGLLILKGIFRIVQYKYGYSLPFNALNLTRFPCMLIGALGAIYYFERNRIFLRIATSLPIQAGCWIVVLLMVLNSFHLVSAYDQEFTALITVFIILGQVTKTHRIVNLDAEAFDFLGKISYGIYVIHPLVIFLFPRFTVGMELPAFLKYILVYVTILGVVVLVAHLSYTYFEKKFLKLKTRFSVIPTSSTKHVREVS